MSEASGVGPLTEQDIANLARAVSDSIQIVLPPFVSFVLVVKAAEETGFGSFASGNLDPMTAAETLEVVAAELRAKARSGGPT